jgi:ubiquinone/menaquinone biosynthesis C-methylase UbiE
MLQTAERVSHTDASDNYVFQRSLLAYYEAAKRISGNILEIGTGSGYGVEIISPKADLFLTIDKFENNEIGEMLIQPAYKHVSFLQMTVPPLQGIEDESMDYVISFQVIEHIKNDEKFVAEIYRVLKKGGKFILTTPNKKMSLTRNPWHIREYTCKELDVLLSKNFASVEKNGVFALEKAQAYYEKNKESVRKIMRFDIFNLQYRLPRFLLQIPYDIMNRRNRKKLLKGNTSLASGITMEDYAINVANDECIDLFYIAEK